MYEYKCLDCGYVGWKDKDNLLAKKKRCPSCTNQTTTIKNSIYTTDKWMMELGVREEDAKKYTRGSNKKIEVTCPDCGCNKTIRIGDIYKNKSISCSCSDKMPYPEKFMTSVLSQLELSFKRQLTRKIFKWCQDKRYDFYLSDYNIIIETHGLQHYEETNNFKRTLAEEQENDRIKYELAKTNGIDKYIVIDCRYSEFEWIKNSILNSELVNIFDLSKIDWLKCEEFALKNIIKEVCDNWEKLKDEMTVPVFAKMYPEVNVNTIREYIKKGVELGWATYDPKAEMKRSSWKNLKTNRKTVYVYKNGELKHIFNSCLEASVELEKIYNIQFHKSGIATYCREGKPYKGFTFKYATEIEKEQNNLKESA